MMKKILGLITVFVLTGATLIGWHAEPPSGLGFRFRLGEHILCGVGRYGEIELEDGTLFKAVSSDVKKVYKKWKRHEYLTFSRNTSLWGDGAYSIQNLDRHETIRADFYDGPSQNNENAQLVFHVDPYEGELYLRYNNGDELTFQVSEKDLKTLEEWEQNDRVVVGSNTWDSWWMNQLFTDYPYIIINGDKGSDNYVRARLL